MDQGQESVFLTAKATAMVCWLFVGSWTFASIFSYLGGHDIIEHWVLALNLEPWQFLVLAQLIIFLLGWPLEWSEILIIFVPIFLPMLETFGINPYFFAMLVALNLQTSSPNTAHGDVCLLFKGRLEEPNRIDADLQRDHAILGNCDFLYGDDVSIPGLALWFPDYLFGKWVP